MKPILFETVEVRINFIRAIKLFPLTAMFQIKYKLI